MIKILEIKKEAHKQAIKEFKIYNKKIGAIDFINKQLAKYKKQYDTQTD
jgi:hypothetical protein